MTEKTDLSVNYNTAGTIANLSFNRPERRNSLSREMLIQLCQFLQELKDNSAVRVVIISGEGAAFCAGQDLTERDPRKIKKPLDLGLIQQEMYHPIVKLINEMDKPVIACVQGIASGAGAGIALACDFLIVEHSAKLAFSFVKIGLSADAGIGWQLVRKLGSARATSILMTGKTISGKDAEVLGLAAQCVEDGTVVGAAEALANQLAAAPQQALRSIKQAIRSAINAPSLTDYLNEEANFQAKAGFHADYREGVLAFLEKRKPEFK